MNINDFKIFLAVAEQGSFTKAAIVMNTVQSNVTARVKFLEEQFDVQLFNRTTRQIELTDAGLKVLKAAKEVLNIVEQAKSSVSATIAAPKGVIKIGCIHSTAALRAPGILERFTTDYPDVEFRLKTGTSAGLVKEVLSFKLDGAFVAGKIEHPDLAIEPVITEELCIVSSSMTPSLEQLKKASRPVKIIVFTKGCSYRELLGRILTAMHIDKFKFIEMDTLDGMINTVEAGIGITLLPAELIQKHYTFRNLVTFPLPHHFAKNETVFIKRKDFPMTEAYKLFIESVISGYSSQRT